MNEREEGLTLSEIVSLMFKKKLVLLIITAVVSIIGIVGILAIYNPMRKKAVVDFYYSNSAITKGKYANGETFLVNDLISEDIILEVLNSDEKYKELNANTIRETIKIEEVKLDTSEQTQTDSNSISLKSYYKLSVLNKSLKNKELALSFFADLLSYPIKLNKKLIENTDYLQNINKYVEAKTYEQRFAALNNAANSLEERYKALIETYGDIAYTDSTGKAKLLSYRASDLKPTMESKNLDTYENSTSYYGIVLDYEYSKPVLQTTLNTLNEQIKQINKQLEVNKTQYDSVLNAIASSGTQVYSLEVQKLIEERNKLETEKIELEYKAEKIELRFANENATNVYYGEDGVISEVEYNKLTDLEKSNYKALKMEDYKKEVDSVLKETYDFLVSEFDAIKGIDLQNNDASKSVKYYNNAGISYDGGLNVVIAILLPIIVGLIIGWITSFVLSYSAFKKEKEERIEKRIKERMQEQLAFQQKLKEENK